MSKLFTFLFFTLCLALNSFGQNSYTSPIYGVTEDSNIVYAVDTNFKGCLDTLELDIYKPINNDTCRPLLVTIHGGSFVDGDKTDGEEVYIAVSMAERGYVVASINYRLGFQLSGQNLNPLSNCDGQISNYCYYFADTSEVVRAAYRAMQDARGAIRFMKGRHAIDSTNINSAFVSGFSAGAVTSLSVDFLDTSSKRPPDTYQIADAPQPNSNVTCPLNNACNSTSLARPDLGGIEGSTNLNGYDASVQGVLSFCGAVISLNTSLLQTVGKEPALFLYHQTCDDVVPCYHGQVYGPINACLSSCSFCSPITGVPYCYGGGTIASFIRANPSLGITCDSEIISNGGAINPKYGCLSGSASEPYCTNSTFLNCHAIVLDTSLMDTIANFLSPFINSCNGSAGIASIPAIHPQFTVLNNPSPDFWTVCNSNPNAIITSTKLYSVLGATVPMVLNYSNDCLTIASSQLPRGIYFLQLETNEGTTTIKLVR